jgi:hypothetical protein
VDQLEAQEALDRLDELIHKLKIDFDRFFIGALPTPPETLRYKCFAGIRSLRSEHHKSASIRFKVNSLEAKLNSLNELFNRRMRAMETGPALGVRRREPTRAAAYDPYDGVVIKSSADPGAVEALYSELYGKSGRDAKTDLESFQGFLMSQAEKVREKTGCAEVVFRVTSDKGKRRLKARPANDAS